MQVNTFKFINFGNSQPLKPLTETDKDKETWTKPTEPVKPVEQNEPKGDIKSSNKLNYFA